MQVSAPGRPSGSDTAITDGLDQPLGRAQRRLLRRVFNGRTEPIVVDGRPFLTYRDASRYLLTLPLAAREAAYADIRRDAFRRAADQA